MGGNIRFRNFSDIYKFPKEFSLEMRYNTMAVSYYREMLNNQLYKKLIPDPPSIEEGRKLLKPGNEMNYEEIHKKNKDPEAEMIDKTFDMFTKMATYTKQKFKKVGETLNDPNFKEDVKFYGNKVGEMGKEFGVKAYSFIKEKIDKKGENIEKNNEKLHEEAKLDAEINPENNKEAFIEKKDDLYVKKPQIQENDAVLEQKSDNLFVKDQKPLENPHDNEASDGNVKNIEENKADSSVFPNYQNNYSSQDQSDANNHQFPDPDDKLDLALDYIDKGYEKVTSYDYSSKFKAFGNGIMSFSKKTYNTVQEKWHDPEFQENMHNKKEDFVNKTKELGEKTGNYAKNMYENLKKKI